MLQYQLSALFLCICTLSFHFNLEGANAWSNNFISETNRNCYRTSYSTKCESSSSSSGYHYKIDQDDSSRRKKLAIITELTACDSIQRMEETCDCLEKAVLTGGVDLISIRVKTPSAADQQQRIVSLAQKCMSLKMNHSPNLMVVINDNIEAAIEANVDGIHVKEKNVDKIPEIRKLFQRNVVIGTSVHTLESALSSWKSYSPDYFFVGTCYLTESHPEKTHVDQLEGPRLPGIIREAIHKEISNRNKVDNNMKPPIIYAIGGINQFNCWEPVAKYHADGVATIRAILKDPNPDRVTLLMNENMNKIPK